MAEVFVLNGRGLDVLKEEGISVEENNKKKCKKVIEAYFNDETYQKILNHINGIEGAGREAGASEKVIAQTIEPLRELLRYAFKYQNHLMGSVCLMLITMGAFKPELILVLAGAMSDLMKAETR